MPTPVRSFSRYFVLNLRMTLLVALAPKSIRFPENTPSIHLKSFSVTHLIVLRMDTRPAFLLLYFLMVQGFHTLPPPPPLFQRQILFHLMYPLGCRNSVPFGADLFLFFCQVQQLRKRGISRNVRRTLQDLLQGEGEGRHGVRKGKHMLRPPVLSFSPRHLSRIHVFHTKRLYFCTHQSSKSSTKNMDTYCSVRFTSMLTYNTNQHCR